MPTRILTLNAGSQSLRFAVFRAGPTLEREVSGEVERIGLCAPVLTITAGGSGRSTRLELDILDHAGALEPILAGIAGLLPGVTVEAVGHRVVSGTLDDDAPRLVTPELLLELRRFECFDPEHLTAAIRLIDAVERRLPGRAQVVCFDTRFHHGLPRVARILPIPRRFEALGLRRRGFHGLSFESLMQELERRGGREAAAGRVVLAHLGNGASVCAVHHGQSVDTTMGFTPTGGLPMGRRSGDLDPGVAAFLCAREGLDPAGLFDLLTHRSGLLGVSETSSDVRDLLALEAQDPRAAEALALFVYRVKQAIGGMAAALGGMETLVFSGGIGTHSFEIRGRICAGLGFLGIELARERNEVHAEVVSTDRSRVTVRVMRTDEEVQIARTVLRHLAP